MNETSRRKFLAAASAGAALGTVSVVGKPWSAPADAAAGGPAGDPPAGDDPVVAWIEDPHAGEIVLMAGDREVVVKDKDLVRRLVSAAGRN